MHGHVCVIFRSGSEAELSSGSQPHEFTKEPPCVDRKTVIKPTVIEKVEQLRQIRHLLNKQEMSSSEEDSEHQQRRLSSLSFGKHVDFAKCKSYFAHNLFLQNFWGLLFLSMVII